MRSKNPFLVLKYDTNGDGSITYLCNNGKWLIDSTPGYNANRFKFWNNSGNAWNCIAKLVKAKKEKFENLFVWSLDGLATFTENDSISFSMIQSLSTDQGELDAIAHEALTEKSEQIELLQETLDELRVCSNFPNSEDA
jgi:hypothetical protein